MVDPRPTPRLTIVTNHPDRAILAVLGVGHVPSWVRIVTTPGGVWALEPGARVIGQWFETRKYRSALEWAFIDRRGQGDLVGLSAEDCERLEQWAARQGGHSGVDQHLAAATGGMVTSERRVP